MQNVRHKYFFNFQLFILIFKRIYTYFQQCHMLRKSSTKLVFKLLFVLQLHLGVISGKKHKEDSDEDDCHPNIEINTWRRLKERMRNEKGIAKREPELHDKWNTTNINRKHKIVVPDPDASKKGLFYNFFFKTTESAALGTTTNKVDEKQIEKADTGTSTPTPENAKETQPSNNSPSNGTTESQSATTSTTTAAATSTTATQPKNEGTKKATKNEDDDDEDGGVVFEARSDPGKFLNENMKRLKKFAKMDTIEKADKFLKLRPYLVHEASEGYLITYAVDRAVEGADTRELERIAERCLQIHNLVQSCQTGNVKPEIGVEIFYKKLAIPHVAFFLINLLFFLALLCFLLEKYRKELAKQQSELMQRIEIRRIERLREMEEQMEVEKAPVGPGGLDPTEVLNSLPKSLQEAFMTQDVDKLKEVIAQMDQNEAAYHMKRCVDAGLWVENIGDENVDDVNNDVQDIDVQDID
ncbi:hypothetical protein RFI_22900 [Reticulomyxa filosa]|uniref:Hsp90 chaperone protein kinase-targeting subunit n=1 Tax=Reticulomyxa filosa TaxID=46433 RepID=X6MLG1_RETFI|nr:hypothetical protein RFI_22900 [Reticulomyxa filosa]|eukprot:ETO14471.1 hypothetical protein RFI_22900 [Reticulomyxa filosa]